MLTRTHTLFFEGRPIGDVEILSVEMWWTYARLKESGSDKLSELRALFESDMTTDDNGDRVRQWNRTIHVWLGETTPETCYEVTEFDANGELVLKR